jgi:para-nitrobenzyl esterase
MTNPIASTSSGELRGREKAGVLLFAGIPYAAPPTGERRFRPPEAPERWAGVRDATRFGPAAPQLPGEGLVGAPNVRWDEAGCLTLNVCTPACDGARRPVLVWIHGGGFRTGQGAIPWYDGSSFARSGIVVVSINYRLGALGFAHLAEIGGSDYAASGSAGIQDQLAALRWVRENIAAFGGDPERVTIAGESAGGMSVGILLGAAGASGLFRGAIPQSGAAQHVSEASTGVEVARRFAQALGAGSIAELLAAPAERVLAAQAEVEKLSREGAIDDSAGIRGMPFLPVVDGRAIPEQPLAAIRAGRARGVNVLVGTNADEMTLFGVPDVDDARLARFAGRYFGDAERAVATYRREHVGASAREIALAISTDHVFRIPAVRLAEAQADSGGRVWKYLFSWKSRAFSGRLGATHALEIPFAFNTLDRPGVEAMLGPGERPDALARRMHAAWTAFVEHGDPACEATGAWSCYASASREVMEFGERVGALRDPGAATRALWDGVR